MRWSIKLGRLLGIPVYLHVTFLLVLGLIAMFQPVQAVILIVAVFGCVVLHEMGHALAARAFGIDTHDVTLLPIGGVARLARMPSDPWQELWIALAGPAVNVAIAAVLALWVIPFGGWFMTQLMMVNIGLVVFNMMPAFPMDGGRVLRALLAPRVGHLQATETAARVGRGMAMLFGIVAVLWGMPMLLAIAVFVWFGGSAEAQMARERFGGRTIDVPFERVYVWETRRGEP